MLLGERKENHGEFSLKTCTLLSLAAAIAFCPTAMADLGDNFFTPDITDVVHAEALNVGTDSHGGPLPGFGGFWTDLVNTENVNATGENVYVAVLDTGLVGAAPSFHSRTSPGVSARVSRTTSTGTDRTSSSDRSMIPVVSRRSWLRATART
jgi:hypothetical protein